MPRILGSQQTPPDTCQRTESLNQEVSTVHIGPQSACGSWTCLLKTVVCPLPVLHPQVSHQQDSAIQRTER